MNYTTNYDLRLPEPTDNYNVEDANENARIVDEELKKRATLDETGKVSADQIPELDYEASGSAAAVQKALEAHVDNKENPHGVDAKQVGAYEKAQVWDSAVAALLGLGTESVPKDGFSFIGKYAQHWWRRRTYRLGVAGQSVYKNEPILVSGETDGQSTYQYSKEVTINPKTLEISLSNPSTVTATYGTYTKLDVLKGCYVTSDDRNTKPGTELCFVPSTAGITQFYGGSTNPYRIQTTLLHANLIAGGIVGEWEYIQSSDRSAYPDSGEQGGYEYQYLGIPLENATIIPKIAVGFYVGTGTSGESNPNSISADGKIKFVIITMIESDNGAVPAGGWGVKSNLLLSSSTLTTAYKRYRGFWTNDYNYDAQAKISEDGRTVSWFNSDNYQQLNSPNYRYHYVVIHE